MRHVTGSSSLFTLPGGEGVRRESPEDHLAMMSRTQHAEANPVVGTIRSLARLTFNSLQAFAPKPSLFRFVDNALLAWLWRCNGFTDTTYCCPQASAKFIVGRLIASDEQGEKTICPARLQLVAEREERRLHAFGHASNALPRAEIGIALQDHRGDVEGAL